MTDRLTVRALNRATLERQGLVQRKSGSVAEVLRQLAGLQAQHANSPYVALWSRREGQEIADLEMAIKTRDVVKATLMRGTIHLVAADNYPIYESATSGSRMAAWSSVARKVGVDLTELNATLRRYCAEPRTVAEMEEFLRQGLPKDLDDHVPAGVRNAAFRMAMSGGGLVHVPPSGLWKSHGRPSYLDARIWLGPATQLDDRKARRRVVEEYLGAYGPASERDILKWMGERRITAVRKALEDLGDRVVRYKDDEDRSLVDLDDQPVPVADSDVPARFLSRWDSVLIAYEERQRILPDTYRDAVIKRNGDFRPTFLVDGFVAGIWSVEADRNRATLTMAPFTCVPQAARSELESEGEELLRYTEPDVGEHSIEWSSET